MANVEIIKPQDCKITTKTVRTHVGYDKYNIDTEVFCLGQKTDHYSGGPSRLDEFSEFAGNVAINIAERCKQCPNRVKPQTLGTISVNTYEILARNARNWH